MKRLAVWTLGLVVGVALAIVGARAQEGEAEPAPPRKAPGAKAPGTKAPGAKAPGTKGPAAKAVAPKATPAPAPKAAPARPPARKAAPKGEEGEEEEGEGAFVLEDTDAVVLRDGTRISGTILCAGQAAVTLLTPQGEKTFPREQVERIIKNNDAGLPRKFTAEELDGHKYLQGGLSGVPAPVQAKEPTGPDIVPPTEPTPAAPATPATPVAPAPAPVAPAPKAAPKAPAAEAAPAAPRAQAGALPAVVFPTTRTDIQALLQRLQREGTLDAYLKDPAFREGLRNAFREAAREAPGN